LHTKRTDESFAIMNIRTLIALLFASVVGTALVGARVVVTSRFQHLYLIGNLLLAWVPLFASILLQRFVANASTARWKIWSNFAVWFLFLPNCPYIFTDLVHLGPRYHGTFWIDMLIILLFALTGLVLGFLSLRSVQRLVVQRFDSVIGWLFVAIMSLLCGIGVYAGRFLRWNSWDVIARPWLVAGDIAEWFLHPFSQPLAIAFPIVSGLFFFATYLIIWSLAHDAGPKIETPDARGIVS
jgi:uncharacterized membrane protein